MPKLTQLDVSIGCDSNTTVSFLLLQTHLQQNSPNAQNQQIDTILFDLYNQVVKVQNQQKLVKDKNNELLKQCNAIAMAYKKNQEELFNVSEDRLKLVHQLKEATDQSLQFLEENQQLKKIVSTMQQLNSALTTRYQDMQKQVIKLSQGSNLKASIKGLSEDYDSMITANNQMKKEMNQIGQMAAKIEEISLPIRVIKVAFNSNKNLRELVMRQAQQQLGNNSELRNLFFQCKFDLGQAMKS